MDCGFTASLLSAVPQKSCALHNIAVPTKVTLGSEGCTVVMRIKVKKKNKVTKVVGKKAVRKDHEVWRVTFQGVAKNIVTRSSSTRAMDEAVEIYGRALKRLADR
jgi:hypothetical protein